MSRGRADFNTALFADEGYPFGRGPGTPINRDHLSARHRAVVAVTSLFFMSLMIVWCYHCIAVDPNQQVPSPTTTSINEPVGEVDPDILPRWAMVAYHNASCNDQNSYSLMYASVKPCNNLPAPSGLAPYKQLSWTPSGFKLCLYSQDDCPDSQLLVTISGTLTCSDLGQNAKSWKVVGPNENC